MIPRKVLQTLVFVLPICLVGFAVLMGGATLTQAMKDETGARVLTWVAVGILLIGIMDVLLLVIALGMNALNEDRESSGSDEP